MQVSVLSTELSVCASIPPFIPPSFPPPRSLLLPPSLPLFLHPSLSSSLHPFLYSSIPPSVAPSIPLSIPYPHMQPSTPIYNPVPSHTTSRRHQLPLERSPWEHRGFGSGGGKEQGGFGCFLAPNSANDGANLAASGSRQVIFGVKSCASLLKLQKNQKKRQIFVTVGTSAWHQALFSPFLCPRLCLWRSCSAGKWGGGRKNNNNPFPVTWHRNQ